MTRMAFPFPGRQQNGYYGRSSGSFKARILIALAVALFAVLSYYARPGDENQVTGKVERVAMADESDEVMMGLQAKPEMMQMHGGVSHDRREVAHVQQVGNQLLASLDRKLQLQGRTNPYRQDFQFTLLADPQTVNAFALPGGQIFITEALYRALETEGQLAGVLGHEIGHVIERHSNKRMAKDQMFQGLAAAGGIAGGDQQSAQMAQAVAQMVSMKYGREDELEADKWGVRLTEMAGYDPRAMIGLMHVLDKASGGAGPPEFMSTHPKPANREAYIERVIDEEFPEGLPPNLKP
ncbi:MAG: M48 family metalloprotease [Pirellulales bacterium]